MNKQMPFSFFKNNTLSQKQEAFPLEKLRSLFSQKIKFLRSGR